MDNLERLVTLLTKEEARTLKMYYGRTHKNNERKDVLLFDHIRKHNGKNEEVIIKKLGYNEDRNSYYRIRNRMQHDIIKVLNELYFDKSTGNRCLNYLMISRIFQAKNDSLLSLSYLKKAEKKAIEEQDLSLLDTIYGDYIKLLQDAGTENPEPIIKKRRKLHNDLNAINEIDDILAAITYTIKTSQNFSKNTSIIKELERIIGQHTQNNSIKQSPTLRFKIYHALSRILLQKQDFIGLEEYLKATYTSFAKEKLFNKSNHESKLQMLTYLANSLYKNDKIEESLKYTELLKKALSEFDKLLYEKYIFYYYNALFINYSIVDREKAIQTLLEAKEDKTIQKLPVFINFIYLNFATVYFDLKNYKQALKNIVQTLLHDSFTKLDAQFQLKINMAELIIRAELNDYETLEKRCLQIEKDFAKLLKQTDNSRDKLIIALLRCYAKYESSTHKAFLTLRKKYSSLYTKKEADDNDILSFDKWLNTK